MEPTSDVVVPAGQDVQAVEEGDEANSPRGQGVQVSRPVGEEDPAVQWPCKDKFGQGDGVYGGKKSQRRNPP